MKKYLNIALDLDGVIANVDGELNKRAKAEKVKPPFHKDWILEQYRDPVFIMNAIPYVDAFYSMRNWFGKGHHIYIVTCRSDFSIDPTYRWLSEWEIDYSTLIHSIVRGNKNVPAEELNIDLFVEDDLFEVQQLSNMWSGSTFLIQRDWNLGNNFENQIESLFDLNKLIEEWT